MPRAVNGMKMCSKCRVEKAATTEAFAPREISADGLYSECRACAAIHKRQMYSLNPEKHRARSRDWNREHAEERKDRDRLRYAADPEKSQAWSRAWKEKNPELVRAYKQQYNKDHVEQNRDTRRQWVEKNQERIHETRLQRARHITRETTRLAIAFLLFSDESRGVLANWLLNSHHKNAYLTQAASDPWLDYHWIGAHASGL